VNRQPHVLGRAGSSRRMERRIVPTMELGAVALIWRTGTGTSTKTSAFANVMPAAGLNQPLAIHVSAS
jgi:hypothetical protein